MDDANSTLCPPLIGQFGPAALSYRIAAAAALVVSSEVVVHYRILPIIFPAIKLNVLISIHLLNNMLVNQAYPVTNPRPRPRDRDAEPWQCFIRKALGAVRSSSVLNILAGAYSCSAAAYII